MDLSSESSNVKCHDEEDIEVSDGERVDDDSDQNYKLTFI